MDTITGSSILLQFLIIIILTGINAFFSGAEMAIVSINKNRLKVLVEEGNKKAILLENLLKEPSKFLSTIQVGITLAGFFASASAATGLAQYLSLYLKKMNIPYGNQLSMIIITFILSYITLVFGELIPKRVALKSSEKMALSSIGVIVFISRMFSPFVKIRSLVEVGREHGIINETEKEMIDNIIEFDEKIAREIMIPRTKVFLADKDMTINELFEKKELGKYSRIPVYEKEADNIVGILHTKDLMMEAYKKGFDNIKIEDIIQEAYFVPETKNVNELFNELQIEKKHIAILIDEYGGFSGIVTLEDLIEEVMGNISDEFDDEDYSIKKLSQDKYLISGELSLNDINDYFHIELESKHYDTLSGLLIEHMGYIPEDDEEIEPIIINDISFKPQRVKDKKIERVLATFNKEKN